MPENQKKILVVEDDLMLRDVYKEVLVDAGYTVEIATNGEECLTKVGSFLPDLILLDIFIPIVSGFDVIDKLKEDPILSRIPVIVLTNIHIDREELVKKGVEHCLMKTEVTPGDVVTKVTETLNNP